MSTVLSEMIGPLLGQAHQAHRSLVEPALAELGLGVKEFGALALLTEEGPLSQQRLGARQRIDRTTVVATIDGLETAGLVERRRDAGDRRAYALHVTARGLQVLRQAREAAAGAEDDFLGALPPADRRRLKELLSAVVHQ
ncbi:MAG: MarR family transcriptional regulator [Actinomycetota bacterium]|nr:MarR family transcriptional regulator [Actinomycetota bacterium]